MSKKNWATLSVAVLVYALLCLCLWWYISPDPADAAQKKDFVQLMAQIAGGIALLLGLYFTWRRVEISQNTLMTQQDQQVTQRFTRAIEQLGATDDEGKKKLEIRLGGIYALERIAEDSPERDYSTVIEILMTYVREHTRWSPGDVDAEHERDAPYAPPDPPADIQAILDAFKRLLERPEREQIHFNLYSTNLSGADLIGANLSGAMLVSANLEGANLAGAILTDAYLYSTRLYKTVLYGANLERSEGLTQTQLEEAIGDKGTILPRDLRRPKSWSQDILFPVSENPD